MPKKLENKLKMEATRKGLSGDRWRKYVYGTVQKVEKEKVAKKRRRKI